jgi:ribosomal protein S3
MQLINVFRNSLVEVFKRFEKMSIGQNASKKVCGVLFVVKGRIGGSDRKRKVSIRLGQMPKQSISSSVK